MKVFSRAVSCAAFASVMATGCVDPIHAPPRLGGATITVSTAGASIDFDASGYVLTVDGERPVSIGVNTTTTYDQLNPGDHVIRLAGLEPNCTIAGTNQQAAEKTVKVASEVSSAVSFAVSCAPNVGTIRVTTETLGSDPDVDGYAVLANGIAAQPQPSNGTQVLSNVRVGIVELSLVNVAGNCFAENPVRSVAVTYNATADVPFTIRCVTSASVRITAATSGVDISPDGYTVDVRAVEASTSITQHLPANGAATVPKLRPGAYEVTINGIQPNCRASGPTVTFVTLESGTESLVEIEVSCAVATPIVYVVGSGNNTDLFVIKSNGTGVTQLTNAYGPDQDPSWSPDGSKIVFSSRRDNNDAEIYVIDANGANPGRLTNSVGTDYRPAWSPDGSKIAFVSERDGNLEIYVMKADGSEPVRLTNNISIDTDPSWSPDGSKIAFVSTTDGAPAIWVINADGSGATRLTVAANGLADQEPAWSPDGTKIAFSRANFSSSGRDIFVINSDGSAPKQVTTDITNAADPSWSPDGLSIVLSRTPSECSGYYYYYYDCNTSLVVVSLDGKVLAPLNTQTPASDPEWRR